MMEGGFKRKNKAASEIPSSSLADMAFLLLIFFMVSTVFPKEKPRRLDWPEADATKKLDEARKDILHVFVEEDGAIYINDMPVPPAQVNAVIQPIRTENPQLVIVLRADRDVTYQHIAGVMTELQEARTVRLTFYTSLEQRVQRERR
ncbi:MAG: biopolymer transporter ExbD [Gemmatimonadota bacterium]